MTTHALAAATVTCPRCRSSRPGEGCITPSYRPRSAHISRWRLASLGDCPFCGARQGEPCRTGMGVVYRSRFHQGRR